MASDQHVNEHEERREQGCSVSAERNSRGWTISAKVWDTHDGRAVTRLENITERMERSFPAKTSD